MRILIADDDESSRFVLAAVLESAGYEVIAADDGLKADAILQQADAPQIAILDWTMPGLHGVDVARQARTRPTDNPPYLIMLTGRAGSADLVAGLSAGANDYLVKPFVADELLARAAAGRRMIEMQNALNVKIAQSRFQAEFHRLAAEISADLAAVPSAAAFDQAVNAALRQLGELFAADRCYLFRFAADLSRMSNTHEWVAPGVSSQMARNQNQAADALPWVSAQIFNKRPLQITDVAELPPEAAAEKADFRRQDIRSLLCLPTIGPGGQLTGFIGFDMVNRAHVWPPEQIAMLQPVVDAVGAAIERLRAEASQQEALTRLERIAAHLPGVIYQYQLFPDGRSCFPYASEGIAQIYEVAPEKARQDAATVFERLHPEDFDRVVASINASYESGEPWRDVYRVLLPQQGERWLAGYASPERLADGSVLWHGFITDISEQKEAEAKIAQYQRELNEIHRIGTIANSTLDLDAILNLILENATTLLNASVGMIFLKEPDANCLTWGASLGLSADFLAAYQNSPIQMGEGLTGTIAQTGQPIFIPENSSDDPRIARSVIHKEGLNSFMGVPILAGEEVIGVMNVLTRPPALLSEHDMHICAAIGSQVGLAISNARLYAAQTEAEASLRASEARLRSYIEHAPYGLFISDENGRYLEVNPAACAITGYDEAELLAMHISDLHIAAETAAALSHFEQVKGAGFAIGEFTFRHKSGASRYWQVSAINLPAARVMAFTEEITERKLAEREIRKYKTIIDNALHGAAIARLDGTLLYVNDYFAETHGRAPEEMIGQHLAICHNESQMPAVQTLLQQKVTMGYYSTTEVWHVRQDGSEFPMLMSGVLIKGAGDEVDYMAATAVDISDRKEAEERLRQSHTELTAALKALQDTQTQLVQQERLAAVGQLAAGIAHDFNNILAVILLYAQMMAQSKLPPWETEAVATIEKQTKTAAHLVQQILDFSRQAMIEKKNLDWLPLLKEQTRLLDRTLPEHITVILQADAPGPYMLHADAARLQQLVLNLALNARDAMPQGGELRLELDKLSRPAVPGELPAAPGELPGGDWLRLRVSDTGEGISPEDQLYIFEPFFTTKPPGQGSGLGLPQAQGIVLQHDGRIEFATEIGQGTTFTVYLPAVAEPAALEAAIPPTEGGRQENILVVEDSQTVRQALIASLEALNYQAAAVNDGREALDYLQTNPNQVDAILSDMIMPVMGGAELFQEIRRQPRPIPMVIITGHQMDAELEELVAQGLAGWLPKPINLDGLAALLAKALQRET